MEMSPELFILLAGQVVSTSISVGMSLRILKQHEKQLDSLDDQKLDKAVHEVVITRVDSDLAYLKMGHVSSDSRLRAIETNQHR